MAHDGELRTSSWPRFVSNNIPKLQKIVSTILRFCVKLFVVFDLRTHLRVYLDKR